jgi:hypothetical protein
MAPEAPDVVRARVRSRHPLRERADPTWIGYA